MAVTPLPEPAAGERSLPAPARAALADLGGRDVELFLLRVARSIDDLTIPLQRLFGDDADALVARILTTCAVAWRNRPPALKRLDLRADLEPDWFLQQDRVGYQAYADRFGGDLRGVGEHLDYLRELGVTYLHLMPLLRPRPGDSDGGYSVMDYRTVDPDLGTIHDLEALAGHLREQGITLCLDLVLNHTAREHAWARAARAGDTHKRDYYIVLDDPEEVAAWEEHLPEVFPDQAPGNFTYDEDLDGWVWTTFNTHQWDLNWANPDVFVEMLEILLHLANKGVGAFRLDAVAFMWKRMGTSCQNQPEVHDLLRALRAASRIAAPSVIHKAEAIVSPKDLVAYLGTGEHTGKVANLAYHNNLMVQFWSSLASGDTRLLRHVLRTHFPAVHPNATWLTYVRCHDDIGWAITPEDAGALGMDAAAHRRFLSDFYIGEVEGSWARGGLFQVNEETDDRRNVGTNASLCGLEKALDEGDEDAVDRAIDRILLGHALIASFGGMPVVYMGDELGLRNDHSFEDDPDLADDARWMHRPFMDWDVAARRDEEGTVEQRIFDGIRDILAARADVPAFRGDVPIEILDPPDPAVLCVRRRHHLGDVLVLCNFTDEWLGVPRWWAEQAGATRWRDLLGGGEVAADGTDVALPPYARLWLA